MKILLVDDEPILRKLFSELLCRKGHDVTVACDGVEGVSLFRNGTFDLVISDYQMPRKNGIIVLREILDLEPSVRTILISGDPPATRLLPVATQVLEKPFDTAEFIRAVEQSS